MNFWQKLKKPAKELRIKLMGARDASGVENIANDFLDKME